MKPPVKNGNVLNTRHMRWVVLAAIILRSAAAAQTATISPAGLTFLTQVVGTTSAAKTATLTNTGSVSLTITSIQTSGDFAQNNNCGGSLAAGTNCTINVTFTPTAMGSRTGTLSVNDDATPSPQTVSLSGSGTIVSLSPSTLSFGNVSFGIASAPQSITLTNVGASTLKVTGVGITGTNAGDFTQSNTCGSSVAANTSCTLTVTFKPTATGSRRATLNVSDNGGASPQGVSLSGTGTTATLVSLAVTPNNPTVAAGITQQFTATGTFTDGSTQNLTNSVSWGSSNAVVASINANGLATGLAGGTSSISAVSGTITNSTTLTVTASGPVLTSITVLPNSPYCMCTTQWVSVASTQQFTATGNYSDGSTQNLTNSVTWTSANTSVASVQSAGTADPGLATGVAAGSTTIAASFNTISGNSVITVAANTIEIPIMDMTTAQNYYGFQGGLYENVTDAVPADHDADGKTFAAQVLPINSGQKNAVVMLGIGMSIAGDEMAQVIKDWQTTTGTNTTSLKLINGAEGGATACVWTFAFDAPTACDNPIWPNNLYDFLKSQFFTHTGYTESQVEVVYFESVERCPTTGSLPSPNADAYVYEGFLGGVARALKQRYPNVKMLVMTSRNYGGYDKECTSPEPYAYEYGFSTKWAIQAQINQIRTGEIDPIAGDVSYTSAPWMVWAAYTWANGPIPRSDGLIWCDGQTAPPCNGEVDIQSDGLHPNATGQIKLGNLLMNFFMNSPYTTGWFLAP